MTVLNLKPRLIWEGDGNTSTVALTVDGVPLIYRDRSHIRVRQLIVATNAESDMVEGVDYNFGLGTISRIAGNLPSGYKWAIWREQPRAQEVALLTGGDLASSDVEDLGNISVEQIQEMQDAIDRAFKLSVFAETGISNELPAPAASNLIGWNAAANALINVLPADVDIVTLISAFMQSVIQAADAAAARTLLEAMAATSLGDGSISGDATLTGNLTLPGLINLSNTSHALLPGGTTAQRPGTPAARQMRFNTTTGIAEYHDGTAWRQCGISVPQFQCYMSLDANNPILTSDAVSQSAVYLHPYGGNIALASNGSVIYPVRFSKQTLTLVSSHLASQIYDCFFWDDGGTLRFVTGPAWNSAVAGSGSRGSGAGTTELTLLGGIYVNAVSMTGRNGNDTWTVPAQEGVYVGSIFMDGTNGEVTCHRSFGQSRKWGLWNAYNRRQIIMKAGDNTSSWPYTSATVRASNGASANSISIFAGLAEEIFDLSFRQNMDTSGSAYAYGRIGIGIDSTTTASGFRGVGQGGTADGELQRSMATASHILAPQLGISVITSLEAMTAGNSLRLYGGEDDMLLTAKWMG